MEEYRILDLNGLTNKDIEDNMNKIYRDGWMYKDTLSYIDEKTKEQRNIMIFEINRKLQVN